MPYETTSKGLVLTGALAAWCQEIQKTYMQDYVPRGVDDQRGYYFEVTFQLLMAAEAKWSKEPSSSQALINTLKGFITVTDSRISFNPLDVLDYLSVNLDLKWFQGAFPLANRTVAAKIFT